MDVECSEILCELEGKHDVLVEKYKKTDLECQKWREKCVGLEASNRELNEKYEEIVAIRITLGDNYEHVIASKLELGEKHKELVKENERNKDLVWSFFNVLRETYRKIKPLGV